jgi:hypothetical protein
VSDPRRLSQSWREPQLEPADHCYTILQDFGPNGGGWGPAALALPWQVPGDARPFVYTGNDPTVLTAPEQICRGLAAETGLPTKLVRFTAREDVASFGGAS